jgi:hypothetical protein
LGRGSISGKTWIKQVYDAKNYTPGNENDDNGNTYNPKYFVVEHLQSSIA